MSGPPNRPIDCSPPRDVVMPPRAERGVSPEAPSRKPTPPQGGSGVRGPTLGEKLRERSEFGALLTQAELAVSAALVAAPVHGTTEAATTEAELGREALSLARTLVSSVKIMAGGGTVNKAGFVQGKGSQVDTLCAELSTLRRLQ